MFEKEAEEYWQKQIKLHEQGVFIAKHVKDAFKEFAEFGYNKANEWHYVKDGDLPKDNMEVITIGKTPKGVLRKKVAFYFKNTKQFGLWNKEYDCYTQLHNVIAWKEIVFPELKE